MLGSRRLYSTYKTVIPTQRIQALLSKIREELKREFKTNLHTLNVAKFMQKGLFCVGFPVIERNDYGAREE